MGNKQVKPCKKQVIARVKQFKKYFNPIELRSLRIEKILSFGNRNTFLYLALINQELFVISERRVFHICEWIFGDGVIYKGLGFGKDLVQTDKGCILDFKYIHFTLDKSLKTTQKLFGDERDFNDNLVGVLGNRIYYFSCFNPKSKETVHKMRFIEITSKKILKTLSVNSKLKNKIELDFKVNNSLDLTKNDKLKLQISKRLNSICFCNQIIKQLEQKYFYQNILQLEWIGIRAVVAFSKLTDGKLVLDCFKYHGAEDSVILCNRYNLLGGELVQYLSLEDRLVLKGSPFQKLSETRIKINVIKNQIIALEELKKDRIKFFGVSHSWKLFLIKELNRKRELCVGIKNQTIWFCRKMISFEIKVNGYHLVPNHLTNKKFK